LCYKKPGGRFRNTDQVCECFTEKDLQKEQEERFRSAAECLSFIAARLDELAQVFKDENDSVEQED